MITRQQLELSRRETLKTLDSASIALSEVEKEQIEVSDFGLSDLENIGLQLVVYVNTERVCAKEIVLLPHQTCPEHRHVSVNGVPGKEETFRCRKGTVYLYVEGETTPSPKAKPKRMELGVYTAWHEIILSAGDQYVVYPDTLHWFQAGPEGAIVSEFSTRSTDEHDIFTDPDIMRMTVLEG